MTTDHFETSYSRRIALWVLRLFTSSTASHYFMKEDCFRDHDVAKFLGLPPSYNAKDRAKISKLLVKMLNELEAKGEEELDPSIEENLAAFSLALNLNATESKVIEFFILANIDPILCDSIRMLDFARTEKHIQLLSKILRIDENEISTAIKKGSWLRQSGLITLSIRGSDKLGDLEFFCSDMARSLTQDSLDQNKIISVMGVNQSETPILTMADYKHVESTTSLMIDYLREVVTSGKRGVNILFHGDPGTGKTQLTRVVAKELGLPLFDFAVLDSDGDPKRPRHRLTSMRVAEAFFKNRKAIFVFDEFEDAISPSDRDGSSLSGQKGWFNHMLENNTKPVFWLSNSIDFLDPAFVRRFDFIIEVPIPPRSSRERILQQHAGKHLSKPAIQRLSQIEELAPAVVARITEVFDVVSKNIPQNQRDEIFTNMVGMTLKSQGHEMPSMATNEILPHNVYDTDCLNTGANLPEISRMLQKHPHARLCLYGPPGTGKTAFGHWLAREIDRPLHVKRASDLLSPFVGMTEKNISQAFESAMEDDALLMIDEVDSFLQDRGKAVRSWEVTQVNELLTRMESFNGIFIASTNRLEHLDSASLRRFDLKLSFDYLNSKQIHNLLRSWCLNLGIKPPTSKHLGMMESMKCVTPGDFAAVARRHRFQPFKNSESFLLALTEDCSIKTENSRRIGFQ